MIFMRLEDLQNDPFFIKLLQQMTLLVGLSFQERAPEMKADELYENEEFFPSFNPDRHNYLEKKVGYVCKSPKGNLVRLIQPYDSNTYREEPEELPAQWGFYWSTDPKRAKEFLKSATSPYYEGACCLFEGKVYRSTTDNNTYSPSEYPTWWEEVPEELYQA